ncbi:MAG: hypothetical protein IKX31_06495 [Muribaculaceae bacterium]|nr:hypothetical protein [Muribaculaceae bacterium]
MKRYATLLLAVLCLVAFSVNETDAKTRKRSSRTQSSSQKLKEFQVSGSSYNGFFTRTSYLYFNGSNGTLESQSSSQKLKFVVTLISLKGNKLTLRVRFPDCDWDEGRMVGTVSIKDGRVYRYRGKYIWYEDYGDKSEEKFDLSI